MYNHIALQEPFYQGDILKDSPFFIISSNSKKLPAMEKTEVMLLSQTCDIARTERDFIIVGRVLKVVDLAKIVKHDQISGLRSRKLKYLFYLPKDQGFSEAYVDFNQITYFPKKGMLKKRNRIKSLSDLGRHWLAYQLADYFGRPFDPVQQ